MHSRSIVALCSLAALATGAGALSAQGRADTRPGLAVFPIWNSGSYGQDKENFDQDRGQKDKATEMYNRALEAFPQYAEATEGLQRLKTT